MKHRSLFISLFIIFVLPFLDYSNSIGSSAKKTNVVNFIPERINYDNGFFQFLKNYDTIFILSDSYVEISLEKQTATVYRKKDTTLTFRISTGNKSIHKGMDTPEGIYTVQSKFRQAISKQFNNAKLFNWIGFNGNIGFHGLEGSSYHRFLGERPSSHGCVRISVSDGEIIFGLVKVGTPVIVFHQSPARIFAFADNKQFRHNRDIMLDNNRKNIRLMSKRLKYIYEGNAFLNHYERIYMDGETALRLRGIEQGYEFNIPARQKMYIHFNQSPNTAADKLRKRYLNLPPDSLSFAS